MNHFGDSRIQGAFFVANRNVGQSIEWLPLRIQNRQPFPDPPSGQQRPPPTLSTAPSGDLRRDGKIHNEGAWASRLQLPRLGGPAAARGQYPRRAGQDPTGQVPLQAPELCLALAAKDLGHAGPHLALDFLVQIPERHAQRFRDQPADGRLAASRKADQYQMAFHVAACRSSSHCRPRLAR